MITAAINLINFILILLNEFYLDLYYLSSFSLTNNTEIYYFMIYFQVISLTLIFVLD